MRVALNMSQVQKYGLPPNPAKTTDGRFRVYREEFGDESWELDALLPEVIADIVTRAVKQYHDEERWKEALEREQKGRSTIQYILQYFPKVVEFLREERRKDTSPVVCEGCGATQNNPKCFCGDGVKGLLL